LRNKKTIICHSWPINKIKIDIMSPSIQKIALVTGASRGIGKAIAMDLAAQGYHIIALARGKKGLEALDDDIVNSTGTKASLIPYDLADLSGFETLKTALFNRFGHLDLLVHAGAFLGNLTPIAHMETKDFERVIKTNLGGSFGLMQATEPLLRAAKEPMALFFTSSERVVLGKAYWGPYGASKAAMESLVRSWADENEAFGLSVHLIDPGAMRTRMRAQIFPGEDPNSLPEPEAMLPFIRQILSKQNSMKSTPYRFRDWLKETA
jgi:NAD(P)-dependent dehydrogenase (short-subunit alcohol dehydrogenase family)